VTGVAGPDGGTPDKPVGLVYVALAATEGVEVERLRFSGDRQAIRARSVTRAMECLRAYLSRTAA
jgi:nicotinamide-nucleotide amidase